MQEIVIGTKLFFLQLDSFVMKDQSKQIEARITPVEVKGIFNYKDESTKYLFDIGPARLQKPINDLFGTEIEAKTEAEKRIANIRINIVQEELVGPKQEK